MTDKRLERFHKALLAEDIKTLDDFCCNEKDAILFCIKHDKIKSLEWVLDELGTTMDYEEMMYACRKGNVKAVKLCFEERKRRLYNLDQELEIAGENGRLEVLQYLYEEIGDINYDETVSINAAREGHLEIIKWFHLKGCNFSVGEMNAALMGGKIHVVNWLHENRKEGCDMSGLDDAVLFDRVKSLKWIEKHRKDLLADKKGLMKTLEYAKGEGSKEGVKWLKNYINKNF